MQRLMVFCAVAGLMVGCGGSGSDNSNNPPASPNQPPVAVVEDMVFLEKSSGELSVEASDSDGSILSYKWTQASGLSLDLENADTALVRFELPEVLADETVMLSVTVTDDDGASVSENVMVTIASRRLAFEIRGTATTGPRIAEGNSAPSPMDEPEIKISAGDYSTTTTGDRNGEYSVAFDVDDSYANALVRAEALGVGFQLNRKLVSLIGSVGELSEQAGADRILNADDNFNVNLNLVSSAKAALYANANNNGEIATMLEYEAAARNYDSDMLFEIAQAAKVVLDYSDLDPSLGIPLGYSDIYEYISDEEVISRLVVKLKQTRKTELGNAAIGMFNDTNSVRRPDSAPARGFEGEYFLNFGGRFIVNEGGSGTSYLWQNFRPGDFTWSDQGEYFYLEYAGDHLVDSGLESYGADNEPDTTYSVFRRSTKIWVVDSSEIVDHFYLQHDDERQTTDGELTTKTNALTTEELAAYKIEALVDPLELLESSQTYHFSIPSQNLELPTVDGRDNPPSVYVSSLKLRFDEISDTGTAVIEVFRQNESGEGLTEIRNVNYEIDGLHLVIRDGQSISYDIVFYNVQADGRFDTNVRYTHSENDEDRAVGALFGIENAGWNMDTVAGIYELDFRSSLAGEKLWFELYEDGTALTVRVYEVEPDGIIDEDDFVDLAPGYWSINTDGNLTVSRYRSHRESDLYNFSQSCTPRSVRPPVFDDCVLYNNRVLRLLNVDEDTFHIANIHAFYDTYFTPREALVEGQYTIFAGSSTTGIWRKLDQRPYALPPGNGL